MNLKDQVLEIIGNGKVSTVDQVIKQITTDEGNYSPEEVIGTMNDLRVEGKLTTRPPAYKLETFLDYLGNPLWDSRFWILLVGTIGFVFTLSFSITYPFLTPVRWVLGGIFVLFMPGFALVEALFPWHKDLDSIERLALSIGLSLALTPMVGLLLNYSPWGIKLQPIVYSLSLLIVLLAFVAAARRYSVLKE